MMSRNENGSKTDPCGTPVLMSTKFESLSRHNIACLRLPNWAKTIPIPCVLCQTCLVIMISKHLEISKRQTPAVWLSLIFSNQSSITRCKLICVECRLIRWNKNMFFQMWQKLGTHQLFHHFGDLPEYRNRPIIRHAIYISIILINRGNPGKFPIIWKDSIWTGIIFDTQQGINNMFASYSDKLTTKSSAIHIFLVRKWMQIDEVGGFWPYFGN